MDEDLTEVLREAGLPESGFTDVLDLLDEARNAALPRMEPSPEMVALWSAAAAPAPPNRRRRAVIVGVGILCGLGAGTAAAAANVLPDPVQEVVADLSERLLPFEFPHPDRAEAPASPAVPGETPVLAPQTPAGTEAHRDDGAPGDVVPSPAGSPTPASSPSSTEGSARVITPSPVTSAGASPSESPANPAPSTSPSPAGGPATHPTQPAGPAPQPPRNDQGPDRQAPAQAPQKDPALAEPVLPAPPPAQGPDGPEGLLGSLTGGLLATVTGILPGGRS